MSDQTTTTDLTTPPAADAAPSDPATDEFSQLIAGNHPTSPTDNNLNMETSDGQESPEYIPTDPPIAGPSSTDHGILIQFLTRIEAKIDGLLGARQEGAARPTRPTHAEGRPREGVTTTFVQQDMDPVTVLRRAKTTQEKRQTRTNWRLWVRNTLLENFNANIPSHRFIPMLRAAPHRVSNICQSLGCDTCDLDHACSECMALLGRYQRNHTYGGKCPLYIALRNYFEKH